MISYSIKSIVASRLPYTSQPAWCDEQYNIETEEKVYGSETRQIGTRKEDSFGDVVDILPE